MEKTFLEKKILQRATEKTDKEYTEFISFIYNNPFGKKVKVKINNKLIPIAEHGCNYALLNGEQQRNDNKEYTNYDEVYSKILEENTELVTEQVLNKLENIAYLFE